MFRRFRYQQEYRRKQRADKRRLRQYRKSMQSEWKAEIRKERKKQIRRFLSSPFASKPLSEEDLLKREIRTRARIQRKLARKQWFRRFRKNPVDAIFFREKNEAEIELAQWRKNDRKVAFRNKVKTAITAFREILKTGELRKKFIINALQSSAYYILAFLLIYIAYQAITILVAKAFDIPTIWYYYRVKFPLFTGSHLYSRAALISIFSAGPILSLALAFFSLKLHFSRKISHQRFKLFYLWGFIHGVNFFFGSYIVGFITRTEFIYVTEWIFLSSMFDVEEIFFALISITICILIGRLATPLFLLSSASEKLIERRYRLYFIISQVFFPWMIGGIVFFFTTNPVHYLPLSMKTITPVIILLPSLFTYNTARNENIYIRGVVKSSYFKWSLIILVIALLFFYRVLLNFGLKIF